MKKRIFQTNNDWTPLILRILLGIVVLHHGAQKSLGWFDGYGFAGTMEFFTKTVGIPWIVGLLVILLETIGAIAIIAGAAIRPLAIAYTLLAMSIVYTSHLQNGFFMNWEGTQAGEGYEFFVLWVAISVSLIISGAGKYSIDKVLISKDNASV